MLRRRAALTEKQKRIATEKIIKSFIGNIPIEKYDKIAGYWPLSGEINIRLLLDILIENHNICCLPVVKEQNIPLTFRKYIKNMSLVTNNKYKTQEPPKSSPKITPTIIIVPLLAFDESGYRVGFGGGFYDRTLDSLRNVSSLMTVGVAYSFQQIASIPYEKHDQKLDCIITDEQIIICE